MKYQISLFIMALGFVLASCGNNSQPVETSDPELDSIRLRTVIYHPGDYNSRNYRIPAIITAKDGSLVIATDKRKNNDIDLPASSSIVVLMAVALGASHTP